SRREFLARCGQGAVAAFIPPRWLSPIHLQNFPWQASTNSAVNFHLHPHYRAKLLLESLLLKVEPGHDQFISEKYAAQIDAVLEKWSAGLRGDAMHIESIRSALSTAFSGTSLKPAQSKTLRSEGGLEVRQHTFTTNADLDVTVFLRSWSSWLAGFAKIVTAEF